MIFDVGVQESIAKRRFFRVHDSLLSKFVREVQDKGYYIFSVIPLFKPKIKDVVLKHLDWEKDLEEQKSLDPIVDRLDKSCIDSHGF
jgi:hypothetical protein